MDFRGDHIWQLQQDSSVVEGFVSLIFDLFLLGICHLFAQSICSNFNLRIVYDTQQALSLHTSKVLFVGHGPIGPKWMTRILSGMLSVCTVCVVLLGFSINGLSENTFKPTSFRSVVSIKSPPVLIDLDYDQEFEADNSQTGVRPNKLSHRLIALSVIDRCQTCSYTHCEYMALGFKDVEINHTLSNSWETIETWTKERSAECIVSQKFKEDIVSWRYERNKNHFDLKCSIVINTLDGDSFVNAEHRGPCDLDIEEMRCFKRPSYDDFEIPVHCAAVGQSEKSEVKQLMLFKNSDLPLDIQITPFAMSISNKFTSEQIRKYLDNVAYMSSLDLGDAYKLDLMAFQTISQKVSLDERNSDVANITEIDLRVALPSIIIFLFLMTVKIIVGGSMFFMNNYIKGRKYFNKFTTVPEILELLLENDKPNLTRMAVNACPKIGILKQSMQIGIDRSADRFLSSDSDYDILNEEKDWDEEVVL